MKIKKILRVLLILCSAALSVRATDMNVYFIGNSLTDRMDLQDGLRGLVEASGHTLSGQMSRDEFAQIIGGANLSWHWYMGKLSTYYIDEFGPAMRNTHWDALVLQAYQAKPWFWNTTPLDPTWVSWADRPREEGDIPMTSNFVDLCVNQGVSGNGMKVYMYSQWPMVPGATANPDYANFDFKAKWDDLYTNSTKFSNRSRDYWRQLRQGVDDQWSSQLSNTVMIVPMGDVMYELNERLRAHPFAGFIGNPDTGSEVPKTFDDVEDIYLDGNHLVPGVAQYLQALTFLSTLYRQDPRGLSMALYNSPSLYGSDVRYGFARITPEWQTLLQEIAWQVTATHFLAGLRDMLTPGDANLDGAVNSADYDLLMAAWGRTNVDEHATGIGWRDGDFDGDGDVDQVDINIYQASATAALDADGDGLPDAWETQHFGGATNANPNAMASNGVNTIFQTYIAGLNPTNPASVLLISDLRSLTSGNTLQWQGISGRVYNVYWSSNLLNGFQSLESNVPWTGNIFTDVLHSTANEGFYKIDVKLAP